ncbi:MAG TPA: hypothetical protein VNQ53_12730 [Nocardioides sp.]|nr:hypothetical protein [Nocardioides sp.]
MGIGVLDRERGLQHLELGEGDTSVDLVTLAEVGAERLGVPLDRAVSRVDYELHPDLLVHAASVPHEPRAGLERMGATD